MSLDIETALITRILEDDGSMRFIAKQRITKKFFSDEQTRDVFGWINKRYIKFGRVPSLRLLQREFPDFRPDESEEALDELCEALRDEKLYSDMARTVKEITDATRADPAEGFAKLRAASIRMAMEHSVTDDIDLTKDVDAIREDYAMLKSGKTSKGIRYPWDYANDVTLGMHPGDLIGIYARPKSMKTWLSLYIANHAHSQGLTPIFFSCEMSLPIIRRRLAAMRANVDYKAFRAGKLTEIEEQRFNKRLKELKDAPPFLIVKVNSIGDAAIAEMRAKCEEYQADLAIVDGFYFLMEEDSHKAFRAITRGMKKGMAEPLSIPVVATTQANRAAEKDRSGGTGGVAFGDSLSQDCDQLMQIIREMEHKQAKELLITMPALREAEGGAFTVHTKPAGDFTQKNVMSMDGEDGDFGAPMDSSDLLDSSYEMESSDTLVSRIDKKKKKKKSGGLSSLFGKKKAA